MKERYADQSSYRFTSNGAARRSAKILIVGAAVYCASLIATMPARFALGGVTLPPAVTDISGRIWNGTASLAGGHAVSWQFAPWRSLEQLALAADGSLTGEGTQLNGNAILSPNAFLLEDVTGRLGWLAIASLIPGISVKCDLSAITRIATMDVRSDRAVIDGDMRAAASTCVSGPGETAIAIPELAAVSETRAAGSVFRLTTTNAPPQTLGDGMLSADGTLNLRLLPAGAEIFLGKRVAGPITLETQL